MLPQLYVMSRAVAAQLVGVSQAVSGRGGVAGAGAGAGRLDGVWVTGELARRAGVARADISNLVRSVGTLSRYYYLLSTLYPLSRYYLQVTLSPLRLVRTKLAQHPQLAALDLVAGPLTNTFTQTRTRGHAAQLAR